MSRKTRGSLINPNEVTIVHAVAKTARNLFLLGKDFATMTQNSHRKVWIVDILEFQSSLMAIDLLDFCVMDNHIHQVLRSRPDVVKKWSNREVARRWLTLCPKSKKRQKVTRGNSGTVPELVCELKRKRKAIQPPLSLNEQ